VTKYSEYLILTLDLTSNWSIPVVVIKDFEVLYIIHVTSYKRMLLGLAIVGSVVSF
jgi:hypothetical protein